MALGHLGARWFLACGMAGLLAHAGAATVEERDAHFTAAAGLIDRGLRLPAQRQIEAFRTAGYPGDELHAAALSWGFHDHFASDLPPAEARAVEQAGIAAKARLDAADHAGRMPAVVQTWYRGAGSAALRLVNDLCQVLDPDGPPPLRPLAAERARLLERKAARLMELAGAAWNQSVQAIAARQVGDDEAVTLRLAALQQLGLAHLALREVAVRGQEFGLDPAPVRGWYAGLMAAHAKLLDDWSFVWGERNPLITIHAQLLLAEGARLRCKGCVAEDIESALLQVCDISLREVPARFRSQVQVVQVRLWGQLLRWRLDLGDAQSLARAGELWNQFRERQQADPQLGVSATDPALALECARIQVVGARISKARGDLAEAQARLGAILRVRGAPLTDQARRWIGFWTRADAGDDWGRQPVACAPEVALAQARDLLAQVRQTGDARQIRSLRLAAAVVLRSGVLGLTGADAERIVASAPLLYARYVSVLGQLGMHHQAALAACDGLRFLAAHGGRADDARNPWRRRTAGDGPWNEAGRAVGQFVDAALQSTQALRFLPGSGRTLSAEVVDLVGVVAPEARGPGLRKSVIIWHVEDGNAAKVIEDCAALVRECPEETWWAQGAVLDALQVSYERLAQDRPRNREALARIAREVAERVAVCERACAEALAAGAGPHAAPLAARASARLAAASLDHQEGRFTEVIDRLGADFWRDLPEDARPGGRALRLLATATARWYADATAAGATPEQVLAAWPRLEAVHRLVQEQRRRFASAEEPLHLPGRNLASAMQALANQVDGLLGQAAERRPAADTAIRLRAIGDQARRLAADLVAPGITARSDPALMFGIAASLWDLGEHARSAELMELYRTAQRANAGMARYLREPAAVLDAFAESIAVRPELKPGWTTVRDLLEDRESTRQRLAQGERDALGEERIDYRRAAIAARDLRRSAEGVKPLLGPEAWQRLIAALDELAVLTRVLAEDVLCQDRLARHYRATGRSAEAAALYEQLLRYDPLDPDYRSAFIDGTIERIRQGGDVPQEAKAKARALAIDQRAAAVAGTESWWTAAIQVMELSRALGEEQPVRDTLRRFRIGCSDLSADLVQPAADARWHDPRVRLARDARSIDLARRYLALFQPGMDEKPTFRIDVLDLDGAPVTVFADAGAPRFRAIRTRGADGGERVTVWEEGRPLPAAVP